MCAPFVKLIAWARSPLAAAMVGQTLGKLIQESNLPVCVERFGTTSDEVFVTAPELRKFSLKYITRDDIAALTPRAAEISGIPLVSDTDQEEVQKILAA